MNYSLIFNGVLVAAKTASLANIRSLEDVDNIVLAVKDVGS